MSKHIYNLHLSPIHHRVQFKVAPHIAAMPDVPDADVSASIPFAYDQGQLGSCVFNSGAMAFGHADFVVNGVPFEPRARLAPYYQYRAQINQISQDTGSSGYDACGIYKTFGLGLEALNPYDIEKFDQPPTDDYLAAAKKNDLDAFQQIPVDDTQNAMHLIRAALNQNKYGVMVGIQVPDVFESQEVADSGELWALPDGWQSQGGHEVYLVASCRNVPKPYVLILNSWGDQWGTKGLNGIRGFVKIGEDVFKQLVVEANVLGKIEKPS